MGWTEVEIKETILQMAIYAGFPAMLNAMFAATRSILMQQSTKDTQATLIWITDIFFLKTKCSFSNYWAGWQQIAYWRHSIVGRY